MLPALHELRNQEMRIEILKMENRNNYLARVCAIEIFFCGTILMHNPMGALAFGSSTSVEN